MGLHLRLCHAWLVEKAQLNGTGLGGAACESCGAESERPRAWTSFPASVSSGPPKTRRRLQQMLFLEAWKHGRSVDADTQHKINTACDVVGVIRFPAWLRR
jgi:hypothetical protein